MLGKQSAALAGHLTEIVNGAFKPTERLAGAKAPLYCHSFTYDEKHPLAIDRNVLGTAMIDLLQQCGQTYVGHNTDTLEKIRKVYAEGTVLLAGEFMSVAHLSHDKKTAQIDLLASSPETLKAITTATKDHIEYAIGRVMNTYKTSS